MWSNTILDEFTTFTSQYAMELLHSLGSKFDTNYFKNESLGHLMADFAKRDSQCFYQLALHAYWKLKRKNEYDLFEIFNEENFTAVQDFFQDAASEWEKMKTQYVANVHVTPHATHIMPLQWTQGHRALRHPAFNGSEDFCLVQFKSNPLKKYISDCPRYHEVLKSGIKICNRQYHFFGVSNSQLREFSYWFIQANSFEESTQKRASLGDLSSISNIGKYVARFGLWFSKTDPTQIELEYIDNPEEFHHRVKQGDHCVTKIDDIERNGYCFTDGNGLMSRGLARLVAERLGYLVKFNDEELYPSAYQIRMAGCKGLIIIDPTSTLKEFYIKIRPSMKKFEYNRWDLEICETSRAVPTRLNNQIIMLMSDLGIPNSTFLNLQKKWFIDQPQTSFNTQDVLKNRLPVPANECRYIFGCALESKLTPGQCFIRYRVLDEHGLPTETPEFRTVIGPVVVTKNPCPYAGDIRTLQAVDIPELYCLQDVLVFSSQGDRPDFHKISGSDLDGDHYFAYWGEELQLPTTVEPLDYLPQLGSIRSTCVTPMNVINYCLAFLSATSYGEIYNLHAVVVDKNKENHRQRTCQKLAIELAIMFAAAIDAGKTGYQVSRGRLTAIRKMTGYVYPDFLMRDHSYPSQSILGILYRKAVQFKKENPDRFNDANTDDLMNYSAQRLERHCRLYVKLRTSLNVDPLTISQELRTIFGDNAPSHLTIEKWFLHYEKSITNVSSEEPSTDTPLNDIEISTGDHSEIDDFSFSTFRSFILSFSSVLSNLYDIMLWME